MAIGRMTSAYPILLVFTALLGAPDPAEDEVQLLPYEAHFKIEITGIVLTDTPVQKIVISARDPDGNLDTTYNERPLIQGIRLVIKDLKTRSEHEAALDPFTDGILILKTDLAKGRKVFVDGSEIIVNPSGDRQGRLVVFRVLRWFSLVPPLLAIILAIWLRSAILSLFVGVWSGAVILEDGNFFLGFVRTLDTHLIGELVRSTDGEYPHILIILFTLFLGADRKSVV